MNKQKAVFLDRDGVINKNREDYVKSVDETEIFQEVGESIKKLKENGFLVVIITNQSAINRGLTTIENIKEIHGILNDYLKEFETKVDGIFICPHRPDENCSCRKPKTGLLLKAICDFSIDVNSSWFIGDRDSDIQAGQSAGCKTLKIQDDVNLVKAVDLILKSI